MRRFVALLSAASFIFAAVLTAEGQASRPQFRPAVLGSGPESLINKINAQELFKNGQRDGAVMFCAVVGKDGSLREGRTYRRMPGSDALNDELLKLLEVTKVAPAIYNHQPVEVLLWGTVIFGVDQETPRVRIFLNQDARELRAGADFIAPQPVFGGDSRFSGLKYSQEEHPVPVTGIVDLAVKVDASGELKALGVAAEDPPLLGFGAAALLDFQGAKFIPAFRDGDATDCETILPICYPSE